LWPKQNRRKESLGATSSLSLLNLRGEYSMGSDMTDDDDCFYYHSWRNNVIIAFGTLSSYLVGFLERKGERKKTLFLIKTQTLLSIGSTPQRNSNSVLKRQHPPKKFVWRVLPTPLSCKK